MWKFLVKPETHGRLPRLIALQPHWGRCDVLVDDLWSGNGILISSRRGGFKGDRVGGKLLPIPHRHGSPNSPVLSADLTMFAVAH